MIKIQGKTKLYSTTVLLFLPILAANPNCTEYGVCIQFVPAPPGHVPNCARSGSTYCEYIDHYPMQLIKYLIEKSGFNYESLLKDETLDELVYRKPEAYGPRHHHPPPQVQYYYRPPPPVIQPALTYGPLALNASHRVQVQAGYPERRYKIDPHILTNALQQPPGYHFDGGFRDGGRRGYPDSGRPPLNHPNLHSGQWWKRYKRSGVSPREKRQIPPGIPARLCPTAANFIMPKAALNTKGRWMFTVNLNEIDQRYTQLVRSETCITDQCSGLCSLPNGYTSRCEQKYVQKRLIALEGGGERLYSDTFWFPHCCECQIMTN